MEDFEKSQGKSNEVVDSSGALPEKKYYRSSVFNHQNSSAEFDEEADSFDTSDSDESNSYYDSSLGSDVDEVEESDGDESDEEIGWCVRVRIIEVENFPALLAPNVQFFPVLKLGLVSTTKQSVIIESSEFMSDPVHRDNENFDHYHERLRKIMEEKEHKVKELSNLPIEKKVQAFGLGKMKNSRALCTSKTQLGKNVSNYEWFDEIRWDDVINPLQTALAVELCGKSLLSDSPLPSNVIMNSDVTRTLLHRSNYVSDSKTHSSGDTSNLNPSGTSGNSLVSLWRRGRQSFQRPTSTSPPRVQIEEASAAMVVAQFLVEEEKKGHFQEAQRKGDTTQLSTPTAAGNQSLDRTDKITTELNNNAIIREDIRLGSLIIPLSRLPLEDATAGRHDYAVTDEWYHLDLTSAPRQQNEPLGKKSLSAQIQLPRIRLEISFANSTCLDDSEDDFEGSDSEGNGNSKEHFNGQNNCSLDSHPMPKRRSVRRNILRRSHAAQRGPNHRQNSLKSEEPLVEPGLVDYICVVGARNIGNNKLDDGTLGWVNSDPECCVLEQFPKDDEFHMRNGRNTALPNKVEWFCYPMGYQLWRGVKPPTGKDLHDSASQRSSKYHGVEHHVHVSALKPAFDECLNCATTFSWFVISSTSESYGSKNVKTYCAVINFYAPAPFGIDPTQDDYAQFNFSSPDFSGGKDDKDNNTCDTKKRLWVPMGICLTSSLPIIGVLESMLLRICVALGQPKNDRALSLVEDIHNLIVKYPAPIPGVLHCSIPFLQGDRYHLTLLPPTGLPPLPHGKSVTQVCKLLGADGLATLLAAVLTECKVLVHSKNVSNLPMVGEVITGLIYPFSWALPYIPVLPVHMLEFLEAPLSYFVGIPSSSLKSIDEDILSDVVVIDLDHENVDNVSSNVGTMKTNYKIPNPLPSHLSSNLSKCVFKLLREEEEVDEQLNGQDICRMDSESLAERDFRIAMALLVCSLVRGYHDCLLFVNSSQPVFDTERFLRTAPALFEEQKKISGDSVHYQRVVSQRSKRFLVSLVNTQNFHGLMEQLHEDDNSLFHDIMDLYDIHDETHYYYNNKSGTNSKEFLDTAIVEFRTSLQTVEDTIPTYRVDRKNCESRNSRVGGLTKRIYESLDLNMDDMIIDGNDGMGKESRMSSYESSINFVGQILNPVGMQELSKAETVSANDENSSPVKSVSLHFLVELEKNPWVYIKLFDIDCGANSGGNKVTIRQALGETRYKAFLESKTRKAKHEDPRGSQRESMDLSTLLTSAASEFDFSPRISNGHDPAKDANDIDILRRCLELCYRSQNDYNAGGSYTPKNAPWSESSTTSYNDRHDIINDTKIALRNPAAQQFLLKLLSQRRRLEYERRKLQHSTVERRQINQRTTSRLLPDAFECLVKICNAMLDACMDDESYISAYQLLNLTAGFCTMNPTAEANGEKIMLQMKSQISMHLVFTEVGLWEKILTLHEDKNGSNSSQLLNSDMNTSAAQYDAAVSTLYEMLGCGVSDEILVRFATRVSAKKGWTSTQKGKSLLLLARNLSVKRDVDGFVNRSFRRLGAHDSDDTQLSPTTDNPLLKPNAHSVEVGPKRQSDFVDLEWDEIAWSHPSSMTSESSASGNESVRSSFGNNAITSLAAFGSSTVATGAVDGTVFLAHSIGFQQDETHMQEYSKPTSSQSPRDDVKGVRLMWGHKSKSNGQVSCLVGIRAAGYRQKLTLQPSVDSEIEENVMLATEGCRIVAGSVGGELNVWSVRDVYLSSLSAQREITVHAHAERLGGETSENLSSSFVHARSRLRQALSGQSLSGHVGGVTCVDVPSPLYQPDTLVSGGGDGLIKLWSLRRSESSSGGADTGFSRFFSSSKTSETKTDPHHDNNSPRTVLRGHKGSVLCMKTTWQGDRLLSGGIDGKVMLWDLEGGGGKALEEFFGHTLWVTHCSFWGPHTIVSASTDRSIALWDVRVGSTPNFVLRHHGARVSDLLLGSRAEPLMVSAGGDGTVATWDVRNFSTSKEDLKPGGNVGTTKTSRRPLASMKHSPECKSNQCAGSVLLARGNSLHDNTVLSAGVDGIVNEWGVSSGVLKRSRRSGHCDAISCFTSFTASDDIKKGLGARWGDDTSRSIGGTISCSWDGTVRIRRQFVTQ